MHTRIDETIARVTRHAAAGNLYVNRDMIGAKVGVQPFGGSGLSGTGPKAGGPLYLTRLLAQPVRRLDPGRRCDGAATTNEATAPQPAQIFAAWLRAQEHPTIADQYDEYLRQSLTGLSMTLPGPVGESNVYVLRPRGAVAALALGETGFLTQLVCILVTGNQAIIEATHPARALLSGAPPSIMVHIRVVPSISMVADLKAVLFEGEPDALMALNRQLAEREGPIVPVVAVTTGCSGYDLSRLVEECSIATNTAAAGGNASLLMID